MKARLLVLVSLALLPVAQAATPQRIELADSGRALGTTYDVLLVISPTQKARAQKALKRTRALVQRLKQRFSEWLPSSEISRINQRAGRQWVPLSREMRKLLRGSLHISRVTGGAFDLTWAPWGKVWRQAYQRQALPSVAQRKNVAAAVGWKRIRLGRRGIRFRHPRTKLGIAGVAKGWIIDAAFHSLRRAGFRDVVVNIGGDLRTSGRNAKGQQRRFYIADPYRPKRMIGALKVGNVAVATSGNYLRHRVIRGRRYGHIIDPRTGSPPSFDGSVTVLTRDATMADALATAMYVMGPTKGLALAKRTPGLDVIYATHKGLLASLKGVKKLGATPASRPQRRK